MGLKTDIDYKFLPDERVTGGIAKISGEARQFIWIKAARRMPPAGPNAEKKLASQMKLAPNVLVPASGNPSERFFPKLFTQTGPGQWYELCPLNDVEYGAWPENWTGAKLRKVLNVTDELRTRWKELEKTNEKVANELPAEIPFGVSAPKAPGEA